MSNQITDGMTVQINPNEFEGRIHKGKTFMTVGEPRDLCGTEVIRLTNMDGSSFSPAYNVSMLQVVK